MNGVGFYGERVVMPTRTLRALVAERRRQAIALDELRRRLAEREQVLTRALHELAQREGRTDYHRFARHYENARGSHSDEVMRGQ